VEKSRATRWLNVDKTMEPSRKSTAGEKLMEEIATVGEGGPLCLIFERAKIKHRSHLETQNSKL